HVRRASALCPLRGTGAAATKHHAAQTHARSLHRCMMVEALPGAAVHYAYMHNARVGLLPRGDAEHHTGLADSACASPSLSWAAARCASCAATCRSPGALR